MPEVGRYLISSEMDLPGRVEQGSIESLASRCETSEGSTRRQGSQALLVGATPLTEELVRNVDHADHVAPGVVQSSQVMVEPTDHDPGEEPRKPASLVSAEIDTDATIPLVARASGGSELCLWPTVVREKSRPINEFGALGPAVKCPAKLLAATVESL